MIFKQKQKLIQYEVLVDLASKSCLKDFTSQEEFSVT